MFVLVLAFGQLSVARAQSRAYTTISSVKVTPLSNGVQVTITADGILQYRSADTSGIDMSLTFSDARNGTGKTFLNVNHYPVSHIQLSTPQSATSGIGVVMQIKNFINTSASVSRTPDGQGVLLTIQSDRTISTNRTGAAEATENAVPGTPERPVDTSTRLHYEDGLLSVRALRADIHSLIAALAQQTGLPVAVDDAVERKVSLNLENVDPAIALQHIASAHGLAFSLVNGVYMLSEGVPNDLATYHLSGTASFRMQNTQAQTVSSLLPNFLFSYVKVNAEQNAVVVTAPSQMLTKIGEDLQKMDVPAPQILIEAIAVELSDTRDLDIGLRVGSADRTSFTSVDVPGGTITYNTIGVLPRDFEVSLRALELKGKARVRARPQMAVVNGRTADIFIGAQRFILTQTNQFGQTQTRIQPVDVGVKLSITPLTGGNQEITTRIAPEVSNITELDLQTGLPLLSTRRANTTVRVKDGETIAIGGLTLNQDQTRNGKIPVLGDLPIIGKLFQSRNRNQVQTELVIFITPRILSAAPSPATTPAPPSTPAPSVSSAP